MLQLDGVACALSGVRVLDGVSLRVGRGETLGLIGPAAAGKSVLLKLACTLLQPDAGRVLIDGRDAATMATAEAEAARARFGVLFQNNALFDFMTVGENVAFPLRRRAARHGQSMSRGDERELARRVAERLRAVGLGGAKERFPAELSGDMRKRVGVARALIAEPEVVLYDEPTAGLDPVTTAKVYDLLAAERERTGATVLVVSSDVEALLRFAPRVALLHQGRLRYDGPATLASEASDPLVRQFVRGALDGPL